MNTSTEAIKHLQQALEATKKATEVIDNLIADHDYQDVASLVAQAASQLIQSATFLMQSQDEAALDALEAAEDLMDSVYDTIDSELDED